MSQAERATLTIGPLSERPDPGPMVDGRAYLTTGESRLYRVIDNSWERVKLGNPDQQPNANIPTITIADGDYESIPVYVPSDKSLQIWLWGARSSSQTTPSGLTVELYDETTGSAVSSASTAHDTGDSLATLSGEADATLRLNNGTGSQIEAGAIFGYTIE